jgi:hypothetical protein
MPLGSHTFWLPRRGNNPDEYEDAFALDDSSGRYALADGATEGCFTGLWARLLVEDFVSHAEWDASQWPPSLPAVEERWDTDVRARKLDWDADYWVERGASAAFLGLVLKNSPLLPGEGQGVRASHSPRPLAGEAPTNGYPGVRGALFRWQAVAVGDTCLFHTRENVLLHVFPLDCSDQFNNRPRLVGSRMPVSEVHKRQRLWSDGCGQSGDRLWAMTDALAKWCVTQHEAGSDPWRELESLLSSDPSHPSPSGRGTIFDGARGEGRFTSWIESLRDAGRLQNDDVTLLAIRL